MFLCTLRYTESNVMQARSSGAWMACHYVSCLQLLPRLCVRVLFVRRKTKGIEELSGRSLVSADICLSLLNGHWMNGNKGF